MQGTETTAVTAAPAAGARALRVGPVNLRAWTVPASLQGLGALMIFATFWIGHFVQALVAHPALAQLDQSSMDPNFFVWSLRWWPYALGHGLNPMASNLIGAPAGFNLSWLTTVPAIAVLAAPVTAVFGPIVTFNLLVAIAPPLAAWAALVLCRRLTGRFWPSLAGGAVYGFSANEMNHSVAGHLNITFSLLLPLMAYLVARWRDGQIGRPAFICLLSLALILQMLIFLETFAGVTIMWVAGLPLAYWLADKPARPLIARLSRQVGVAYLAAIAIASPYLVYVLTHAPVGFALNVPRSNSLNLESLIVPRPKRTFQLSWLHDAAAALPPFSQAGYVGIPLLLLVTALAIWTWKSRSTRFLVIMFVFAVLVAAGPELALGGLHPLPAPWALLWKLPLARSAFPVRFMVFAYLALALMVAAWLSTPLRHSTLRWLLAGVSVAAVIVNIPFVAAPVPSPRAQLPSFLTTGQYGHYLRHGETILVISSRGNAGMLFQADTGFYFKVAGGFVNQAMSSGTDLPLAITYLAIPDKQAETATLDYLIDTGIGAVLYDNHYPQPELFAAIRAMGLPGHVVGGVTLFQVPRAAA